MSPQSPREETSAFLRLPTETRLQIYSYLLPCERLFIDLCNRSHQSAAHVLSDISSILSQSLNIEEICRKNGLHLLLVSRLLANDLTSLLRKLIVRFHCPRCYSGWLSSVSYGLGVGIKWMRHIEIIYNVEGTEPRLNGPDLQFMTKPLARFMVVEMLKQCQQTSYAYYGRLDLMIPKRDKWNYMPFQDPSAPWADHPNFRHRTPHLMIQRMFNGFSQGGLHLHPWVLNGGFPAPGMNLPVFPDDLFVTRQGLHQGFQSIVYPRGLPVPEDQELNEDDYQAVQRKFLISGKFDI